MKPSPSAPPASAASASQTGGRRWSSRGGGRGDARVEVLRHAGAEARRALELDLERVAARGVVRHQVLRGAEGFERSTRDVDALAAAEKAEALAADAVLDLGELLDHLGEPLRVARHLGLEARALNRPPSLSAAPARTIETCCSCDQWSERAASRRRWRGSRAARARATRRTPLHQPAHHRGSAPAATAGHRRAAASVQWHRRQACGHEVERWRLARRRRRRLGGAGIRHPPVGPAASSAPSGSPRRRAWRTSPAAEEEAVAWRRRARRAPRRGLGGRRRRLHRRARGGDG